MLKSSFFHRETLKTPLGKHLSTFMALLLTAILTVRSVQATDSERVADDNVHRVLQLFEDKFPGFQTIWMSEDARRAIKKSVPHMMPAELERREKALSRLLDHSGMKSPLNHELYFLIATCFRANFDPRNLEIVSRKPEVFTLEPAQSFDSYFFATIVGSLSYRKLELIHRIKSQSPGWSTPFSLSDRGEGAEQNGRRVMEIFSNMNMESFKEYLEKSISEILTQAQKYHVWL